MINAYRRIIIVLTALAGIFLISTHISAQTTGKIAGRVLDAETGQPLPGVNVMVEGTDQGAATDSDGEYFIINLSPGTYSVSASYIGYQSMTKTGVQVQTGHTTPVDFQLGTSAIQGEAITVEAEREIVNMDQSSSIETTTPDQIEQTPLVNDITGVLNLQAGVEGMEIRGGSLDQTKFMLDGLMMVDNRANEPIMDINLSSVQEVSVIKGGFNAEFGNVRSGLVNVVTQEGSQANFHGSIDFRYTPPHLKHSGASIFDADNFYQRSYRDPAVMWEGTNNGAWDEEMQRQNRQFEGWNSYSERLLNDDDPSNDMTPEQAAQHFLWMTRAEGSGELGQVEGNYGHKPDYVVDIGLGGPVPLIGKFLGNATFFASFRGNNEMFALPKVREYYRDKNSMLKLTHRLTDNMKLNIQGMYSEVNSLSRRADESPNVPNDYFRNGRGILFTTMTQPGTNGRNYGQLYWPDGYVPFDVYKNMQGISLKHTLSPNTFYNIDINRINVVNRATESRIRWRDTTTVRYFGNQAVDERPIGFWYAGGNKRYFGYTWMGVGGSHRDMSVTNTYHFKGDITSQVNKYHQLKGGFLFNYDDIDEFREKDRKYNPTGTETIDWQHTPVRAGAYIQDKIEYEGMIMNVGVRMDYADPRTEWYTAERYSRFFSNRYADSFEEMAPTEEVKPEIKISPRVGISHPISAVSKLYFNYGHFYSMANSEHLYGLRFGVGEGVEFIGNPDVGMPRTVSYELGYEHSLANMFSIRLAGYYRDITEQTGSIYYTNYDRSVDYRTIANNNYQDIRGFELSIHKNVGQWVRGWMNYNYMVETSGYIGREHYYEDPREQRIQGLQNPYQEKPLPRPLLRANIQFLTPRDFGPSVVGIKPLADVSLSFLYSWKAGNYTTWDPLNTYELNQNLQWKPSQNVDLRFSKRISIAGRNLSIFMDVHNLFNHREIYYQGFETSSDYRDYVLSLKLPLYNDERYQNQLGVEGGTDQLGDIKSEDKPYIDMPNRDFLTYLDPRVITFGFKLDF